ncbi:MAG: hypothetical protein JO314_09425 [Acidobacteria bacterium]|nr:hypothetical protein [Acidobacteriota bacterium]
MSDNPGYISLDGLSDLMANGGNAVLLVNASWNKVNNLEAPFYAAASEHKSEVKVVFGLVDADDKGFWDFFKSVKLGGVPVALFLKEGDVVDRINGAGDIVAKMRELFP